MYNSEFLYAPFGRFVHSALSRKIPSGFSVDSRSYARLVLHPSAAMRKIATHLAVALCDPHSKKIYFLSQVLYNNFSYAIAERATVLR